MKCNNCHRTVTKKSKFCPNCGEKIVPRNSSRQAAKKNVPFSYVVGLITLGIVLGFLVFKIIDDSQSQRAQTAANLSNTFVAGQTSVSEIGRGLNCICGTCEHTLNECDCEHPKGALEVKGFIMQQLQAGHKKPHILEMLFEKYPEFKS